MAYETPNTTAHAGLPALASRYVDPESLPWVPTRFPGVDVKVLVQDPASGMSTALTRFAAGATLPAHEHAGLEQSWVLEGALEDDEGTVRAGGYVWRPAGSTHAARSPAGCVVLSIFMKPNRFVDDPV